MSKVEKLLPCPFCGGEAEVFIYDYTQSRFADGIPTWKHGIHCMGEYCGISVTHGYAGGGVSVENMEQRSSRDWNRRY